MFKSFFKEYKKTHDSILNDKVEQQQRLNEFSHRHKNTLNSMNQRKKEFETRKEQVRNELSRHF